jgi:hypothetical protein
MTLAIRPLVVTIVIILTIIIDLCLNKWWWSWCEDSVLVLLNISIAISHFLSFHSITINWVLHVLQLGKGQVVGLLYWNPYLVKPYSIAFIASGNAQTSFHGLYKLVQACTSLYKPWSDKSTSQVYFLTSCWNFVLTSLKVNKLELK